MKFLYPYLIVVFIGLHSKAQSIEDTVRQIANDTSESIWEYNASPEIFYQVGKILAKRDIAKGVFLIQSYGNPDWEKPCSECRYENYGFKFVYHWDIIYGTKSAFIDGYNEVSEAYLKKKIGAIAFAGIEVLPSGYFDPSAILRKFYYSKNRHRFYEIEEMNDSTIRVKMKIDSVFKYYPKLVKKIVYAIKPVLSNSEQILNYNQMKQVGFTVVKNAKGEYAYSIRYDFSQLPANKMFCGCTFTKNIYSYIERLKIAE